ncbi:hypothetical protein ACFLZG_07505 [Thermodesulfobacteriota bacterium]
MSIKAINLHYKKRPSLFKNISHIVILAIWRSRKKFQGVDSVPRITATLDGFVIDQKHLYEFNKICEIKNSNEISLIYPMTLVFPLIQRMLGLKEAPLSVFNVLGKRLQIEQYRKISIGDELDIHCETTGLRIVPKGLEFYISAIIQTAGTAIWKATETFFYRGNFGDVAETYEHSQLNSIPDAEEIMRWYLPEGLGFRFVKITGDGNGIHYSKQYARLLGFERDFAQPFLVLGNSINRLLDSNKEDAISLDVALKGPLYYERDIIIKGILNNNANQFEIYNEGNERPCMVGIISAP